MKNKLILIFVIFLAFFLRFYKLGEYPAPNADEAALGYNAYSLLQTGKDEHGNSWPIHFESFGDYKPGLYVYLLLPLVKYFGLNEWTIRIPGALLGVLTVWLVYKLVNILFKRRSYSLFTFHYSLGEISAFMLAISPWHIHFSRGGWEVNVATFFLVLGVYLFLAGLDKTIFLYLSSLVFSLSLYTYHAARVVAPFLVLGLLIIYRDIIKKNIKKFIIAGIVGLVILLPLVKDLKKPEIMSRAAGVGLFADVGPLNRTNEQRGEHSNYSSFLAKVLHNKIINYGLTFLENYADHFHGEFLFLSGDNIERNKVPETGQMYIFDLVFLIIGITYFLKSKIKNQKSKYVVILWLLVAPIPSALTFQSPHALRSQNMVIPLVIISSFGLAAVLDLLKNKLINKYFRALCYAILSVIIFWQFLRYEHMYWVHMAKEYPYSSQYGLKELVGYIEEVKGRYQKIIVTDRYDQPYILFLFYLKYPPNKFQHEHFISPRDTYGFSTVTSFANFEFKKIIWDEDRINYPGCLIVGTDQEIPDETNIVKEIYGSNGYKYFQIVAN